MRWLFILLVMMNIGYVAWELNRERPQKARAPVLPTGVEPIVLLSELAAGPDQPAPADTEAVMAAAQPQAPGPADGGAVPTQLPVIAEPEMQTAALDTVEPVNSGAQQDAGASAETPTGAAAVGAEMQPAADLCYTLGPFKEMKTLRVVTRKIKDYVIEASFRSKEEQEQTMFRVLIRPVGSKNEAKALIRKLDSKNIRDHFILTEGPNKNGISLGYFSSKARAHKHADRVRKLGFDAFAEPVFRSYTIYWLDYRIEPGIQIPQQIFDSHIDKSAQKLSRACS